MTTITREQQKQILIDTANHVISRDNTSPYSENLRELARIALASLEAEPVAYIFKHPAGELFWSLTDESNKGQNDVMPVYAAQPVQETGVYKDMLNIIGLLEKNEWAEHCTSTVLGSLLESEITRLVGKELLMSVVPETLPCPVHLVPGLRLGKGCKTETLLIALQRRAEYYAGLDAMTPEELAKHYANIEAFKAMLPQSAPVAPEDLRRSFEAVARLNNEMYRWTSCMSYNGSYVGEPEGLLKRNIREIERILDSCRSTDIKRQANP